MHSSGIGQQEHVKNGGQTTISIESINQSINQSIESLLTQPAHYLKASKAQRA